jgi:hypothetical protein
VARATALVSTDPGVLRGVADRADADVDRVEMTMSCTGVPQQYTFVDVGYDDPSLPITPSTGQVHVVGQIVDVAENGLGFRELVVHADRRPPLTKPLARYRR